MTMEKLTWDLEQLNTLRTSAIQWELLVNGIVYEPESLHEATVGETIRLQATVKNHLESALENADVSMTCRCDHVTCDVTTEEEYVTYLGSTSTNRRTINQSECLTLDTSLLFLSAGSYTLQVTCSSRPITASLPYNCYPLHLQVVEQ